MTGSLDWLWKDDVPADKASLNEGVEFSPGFTGLWHVAPMWRVWDSSGLDLEEMQLVADGVQTFPTGSFYYYKNENYDSGLKLCNALGLKFGPAQVWRWEMDIQNSIGMSENGKAAFGPVIGYEVNIGAYYGKNRTDLHLIALPSAVQAIAVAGGFIKENVFDYQRLVKDLSALDNNWQHSMVGDDNTWEESELWKAREKIWKALGEDNPKAYMFESGSEKYDTESKMLGGILRILYDAKGSELYARVLRVPNPRVDAVTKDGKRLQVLCIETVYKNQEAAEKAEGSGESVSAVVESVNSGNPPLPLQWKGSKEKDWIDWLREFLTENELLDKPIPIIVKGLEEIDQRLQDEYACSAAEIQPWLEIVKK